jgi:MFS transporter, DHA3 family, macrolide efflux protein
VTYQAPPHGFRTFVIVWATQSISVFGSALTFFALNIWLAQTLYPRPEQKSQLALALSLVSLAFAIPVVFAAPLAGAWADRHDRKRTMITMDVANGVLTFIVALLVMSNTLRLWMLIVVLVLMAFISAFHSAAFDTSYAMIVPEEKLPRANGMMQTIWALSGIVAPAIAATIIALPALARQGALGPGLAGSLGSLTDGTALAMLIDAVTFFFAAMVLVFLFIPSPVRTDLRGADGKTQKSIWSDIKEGGLYIWHRRPLLWLLATFAAANLLGGPLGVLQPMLVKFNYAADWASRGFTFEIALATLSSVMAVGGVVGGLLVTAWGGLKRRRVYGVVVPIMIAAIAMVVIGMSAGLIVAAAAFFVYDAMTPVMNTHSQTIWQTQVPREKQGRVFAVRRLIAQFTWPLGAALAGWLGGRFDPGLVIAVLGGLLLAFGAFQLFNPQLLRVEDKAMLDDMAARAAAPAGELS